MMCSLNLFAFHVDKKCIGASLSYDIVFNNSYRIFTLNILDVSAVGIQMSYSAQFSPDVSVFDVYIHYGFIYPFGRIFSIRGSIGHNLLPLILLHHFSYIASARINIYIPISRKIYSSVYSNREYSRNNLMFGMGLRHRNAIRMFNYLNLSDRYFNIYNSFFFEIGFRHYIRFRFTDRE